MAAATPRLRARASVTVRVSQAAPGDLETGARTQIERVDGVRVDEFEIDGLSPGLNDTTVEATATVSVEPTIASDGDAGGHQPVDGRNDDVESSVADRLAAGFGVEPERVDLVEPGA